MLGYQFENKTDSDEKFTYHTAECPTARWREALKGFRFDHLRARASIYLLGDDMNLCHRARIISWPHSGGVCVSKTCPDHSSSFRSINNSCQPNRFICLLSALPGITIVLYLFLLLFPVPFIWRNVMTNFLWCRVFGFFFNHFDLGCRVFFASEKNLHQRIRPNHIMLHSQDCFHFNGKWKQEMCRDARNSYRTHQFEWIKLKCDE